MNPTPYEEYPPLLEAGLHPLSLDEVHVLCVERFSDSNTRAKIFEGVVSIVEKMASARIPCKIYLDGSFLTKKENPSDIDALLVMSQRDREKLDPDQEKTLTWATNPERRNDHNFDNYLIIEYDKNHVCYESTKENVPTFLEFFENGDKFAPKGIAVVELQGKQ